LGLLCSLLVALERSQVLGGLVLILEELEGQEDHYSQEEEVAEEVILQLL
jgi:hypothetical protein